MGDPDFKMAAPARAGTNGMLTREKGAHIQEGIATAEGFVGAKIAPESNLPLAKPAESQPSRVGSLTRQRCGNALTL